jgi:hypothetical protein
MEKRTALLITTVFAIGLLGGIFIGSTRTESQHIKTEYYLEMKPDHVLIEDTHGNCITCPYDKIHEVLLRDNL